MDIKQTAGLHMGMCANGLSFGIQLLCFTTYQFLLLLFALS